MVEEHRLSDAVRFQFDVPVDEVVPLIQAHHAVVLPYRDSRKLSLLGRQVGASGALCAALACGRGALTSDARAFVEDMSAGQGAVFRQGSTDELAEWIIRLAESPEILASWASKAAEFADARRWRLTAERFKTVLINAAKDRGA
jgi:glycosyltransferase involved in cell wall biosynthesis